MNLDDDIPWEPSSRRVTDPHGAGLGAFFYLIIYALYTLALAIWEALKAWGRLGGKGVSE